MFKKISIVILAIIICTTAIIYSQNGKIYKIFSKSDSVKTAYTESQIVKLPIEKIRTLNPVTSMDSDTYQLSKLIFESLFYLDENLSLKNGLANSYIYNKDKNSATINIKSNSYFSDGTNVTGEDVKFSIDSYIKAATTNNTIYSSYVSNIKYVSTDKSNKYSVDIKFKNNKDVSKENFIFPIISKSNFGKNSVSKLVSSDFIPIGSGRYAIEKYNSISELQLVANKYFSGTKPTNTLCFSVLPEKEDVIPLLEVNNISLGYLESLSRDTLIADKQILSINFPSNKVEVVGYNFSKPTIAVKEVRQAIAYAVDSKKLNENAYYKNGMYCDSIYFPGYLGIKNTGDNYLYNLDKASGLLISANFLDRDGNGYLEDKDGNELVVNILVNKTNKSRVIVAEDVKAALDKLAISSKIIYAKNAEEFNSKLSSKDFDIFIGELKINETYDLRPLLHSDYNNVIGYSNLEVDILLDKLKSNIDQKEKVKTVSSIKNILIDELPYYCIVYKTYGILTTECLNGNDNDYMFNNLYNNCDNWYSKYPVKEVPKTIKQNPNENSEN